MNTALDLQALADGPMLTPQQRRALHKRLSKSGHAMPPGTGPFGETRRSCQHLARNQMHSGKTFMKCALRRANWTSGYETDVRARDAACSKWEARA